ncbi:MAG: four helix bundle protein [Gemmatimonadales bacterium]
MSDFKKLDAWQLAHSLSVDVYRIVRPLPPEERYGLRSQITRAAGSIPANLAEGCGRSSSADLARFVDIAMGSATELECHLLRARDLGFVAHQDVTIYMDRLDRLQKMLSGLVRALRARAPGTNRTRHSPPATHST